MIIKYNIKNITNTRRRDELDNFFDKLHYDILKRKNVPKQLLKLAQKVMQINNA